MLAASDWTGILPDLTSGFPLLGGLDWRLGSGFEPLVLVEGKWETIPI